MTCKHGPFLTGGDVPPYQRQCLRCGAILPAPRRRRAAPKDRTRAELAEVRRVEKLRAKVLF